MRLHRSEARSGLQIRILVSIAIAFSLGMTSQAAASSLDGEAGIHRRLSDRLELHDRRKGRSIRTSFRSFPIDEEITLERDIGKLRRGLFDELQERGPIRGMRRSEWARALKESAEGLFDRIDRSSLRKRHVHSASQVVPEPGTAVLLSLGLCALATSRRSGKS